MYQLFGSEIIKWLQKKTGTKAKAEGARRKDF